MPKRSSGTTARRRHKKSHLCQVLLTPSKTATRGCRLPAWSESEDSDCAEVASDVAAPGEYGGGEDLTEELSSLVLTLAGVVLDSSLLVIVS